MKVKDRKSNRPESWLDSGWKVPVHLTDKQERYAWRAMGIARFAFNLACATHAFHRANRMQWPYVSDIQKAFNACKREDYPLVLEVSKFVAQGGFQDFEKSVKNWRDCSHPAGRPTLRRRKDGNGSFLAVAGVDVLNKRTGNRLRLPVMGSVKLMADLPDGYISHEARIVRENGRWYLSLLGYRPPVKAPETQAVAGVDVGIPPLAVVHRDGDEGLVVENPKAYCALERKLRRWQRAQARRTKGSRGWWETQRGIDKLHRRIRGNRDNVQHQLSAHLVKTYGHIGIESLRVKALFQNAPPGEGPCRLSDEQAARTVSVQGPVVRTGANNRRDLLSLQRDLFRLRGGESGPEAGKELGVSELWISPRPGRQCSPQPA